MATSWPEPSPPVSSDLFSHHALTRGRHQKVSGPSLNPSNHSWCSDPLGSNLGFSCPVIDNSSAPLMWMKTYQPHFHMPHALGPRGTRLCLPALRGNCSMLPATPVGLQWTHSGPLWCLHPAEQGLEFQLEPGRSQPVSLPWHTWPGEKTLKPGASSSLGCKHQGSGKLAAASSTFSPGPLPGAPPLGQRVSQLVRGVCIPHLYPHWTCRGVTDGVE